MEKPLTAQEKRMEAMIRRIIREELAPTVLVPIVVPPAAPATVSEQPAVKAPKKPFWTARKVAAAGAVAATAVVAPEAVPAVAAAALGAAK